jgi:hypothetical protein
MSTSKTASIFKTALYVSSLCGAGYFAAIVFLHLIGLSLTGWGEWVYRIALIISVIWSILGYRLKFETKGMGFGKSFGLGMLSSFILGIYMSLSALVFHYVVAPDYNEKYKSYYRAKRSEQMYNTQLNKMLEKNEVETYKLTASDSAIVEKGLNLHIEKSQFHFTANGAALINLIFSLVWGLAISGSVAFMARKQ